MHWLFTACRVDHLQNDPRTSEAHTLQTPSATIARECSSEGHESISVHSGHQALGDSGRSYWQVSPLPVHLAIASLLKQVCREQAPEFEQGRERDIYVSSLAQAQVPRHHASITADTTSTGSHTGPRAGSPEHILSIHPSLVRRL